MNDQCKTKNGRVPRCYCISVIVCVMLRHYIAILRKDILQLHDNARPHAYLGNSSATSRARLEIPLRLSYPPDRAPPNYYLSPS
ncbi:hypothetical protein TNCV_3210691 [Trichonephila clavipes]|nr:hypothetical protein TNCV_3210691 [Trichonephila clavipes]